MSSKRTNVAIILAGGKGSRLNAEKPKQFLKLAGKAIIEHTIDAFQMHEDIDEIAIVCHADYVHDMEDMVNRDGYDKVKKVLMGGRERYHSSLSAINAYVEEFRGREEDVCLVFHDAVRPFVSHEIISRVIERLETYRAVDVAIPTSDTIIALKEGDLIEGIPKRSMLRRGQTPQAFRLDVIRRAYELAMQDEAFTTTDDCGVVLRYLPDEPISVVEGGEENIKVTFELDLFLADKLFQLRRLEASTRANLEALSGKVVVIFGGSYGIGKEMADMARAHTPLVYTFSRSQNGVDVRDREAVRRSLAEVHAKTGRIDYVVNTAAILNKEPLRTVSHETIQDIVDINLVGMVTVAKEAFEYLEASKGHLLLFTSSSYTRGRASYSLYSSTKAAAVNFVQAIAEEWHPFGIRVNCINPERTKTPMRTRNFGIEPEHTLLSADKVAHAALGTLTSSYTGQVVYVKR